MNKLTKDYIKWHKNNVYPDCHNADCQKVDRGGACGNCIDWSNRRIPPEQNKDWEKEARRLFNPYAEELNFDERDWKIFLNRLSEVIKIAVETEKK